MQRAINRMMSCTQSVDLSWKKLFDSNGTFKSTQEVGFCWCCYKARKPVFYVWFYTWIASYHLHSNVVVFIHIYIYIFHFGRDNNNTTQDGGLVILSCTLKTFLFSWTFMF